MQLARELARRSAAVRFEDLPADAVHSAKVGILDTVGVTLAGCGEPAARIVRKVAGNGGASLVFGTAQRINALDAALVNGVASHALDFDDMNNTLGGHPSAPILPALFALADERPASGRAFIAAYVAGFETECKLGRGVHFHHYTKGWHPTATLGVFGTAAAAGNLMGLDAERTAIALAIAASLAACLKANFGTMTKPLHVGHCARSGLFAALLAAEGFTANPGAFEHNQGFLDVFNGPGTYDVDRMLAHWGDPFDIVAPGIALKQYPCCGSTHPALDVMLDLVRRHDLRATEVARIDAWTHARRLEHTNRPDPHSGLEAKFSLQYCLARALVDRAIRIEDFEGDAWADPKVRAVLPRVNAAAYTTTQFPEDNHYGAEVKITTTDGKAVSGKIDEALGRTTGRPLPRERLREKFDN
ncbi:MAG TPA: MmgE/PrpD family protein, partial [Xanthobacteraceae bacterium]|nr:MmgE/PrpD family protein [Xanthobacteraceae bacterium]